MRAAHLGRPRSPEHCAAISAGRQGLIYRTGWRHSPETRAKIAASAAIVQALPETRAKISLAKTGVKRKPFSARWKKRLSLAAKASPKAQAHRARIGTISPTSIEIQVRNALNAAGVEFVFQFQVPDTPYVADFYLPYKNTILEADGDYWHRLKRIATRDARRDADLTARGYRVVRLSETQIRTNAPGAVRELALA